ncbi:hypothetical protein F3K36_03055 [Delftia sp. BR1]|nr:hypothetical protein F3K36_03055 [Delftia sp. BR1]
MTLNDNTYLPRAELPGSYHVLQSNAWDTFRAGDRVPGTGALAGRNLIAVHGSNGNNTSSSSSAGNTSIVFLDVTGPWR